MLYRRQSKHYLKIPLEAHLWSKVQRKIRVSQLHLLL